MTRRNNHLPIYLTALLLVCSLVLAQWAGLQHRVAHAWLQPSNLEQIDSGWSVQDDAPDKDFFHSCDLLDANTVGACIASADYAAPLLNNLSLSISVLPLVSWQALFTRQFSSRAPPFSTPV